MVAALSYLMLGQTGAVGSGVCGARVEQWLARDLAPPQLSRVIDVLERTDPPGRSPTRPRHEQVADRLGKRSLVVAITDAFAPLARARQGLARP